MAHPIRACIRPVNEKELKNIEKENAKLLKKLANLGAKRNAKAKKTDRNTDRTTGSDVLKNDAPPATAAIPAAAIPLFFDVDDTLSPTFSIVADIYALPELSDHVDAFSAAAECFLKPDQKLWLARIDAAAEALVLALLRFSTSPCPRSQSGVSDSSARSIAPLFRIVLVTAAGEDGFLAVCSLLPRLTKVVADCRIPVYVNHVADGSDFTGKVAYKAAIFEAETLAAFSHTVVSSTLVDRASPSTERTTSSDPERSGSTTASTNYSPEGGSGDVLKPSTGSYSSCSNLHNASGALLISIGDGQVEADACFRVVEKLNDQTRKSAGSGIRGMVVKLRDDLGLGPEIIWAQLTATLRLFEKILSRTDATTDSATTPRALLARAEAVAEQCGFYKGSPAVDDESKVLLLVAKYEITGMYNVREAG
eukprot:1195362-Prorocentrum_minimum.AAC.7